MHTFKNPVFVLATAVTCSLGTLAVAAPVDVAIDLDSTRLNASDTSGDLVTQDGFVSWNVTDVQTSGTTFVEQGVTFELFGLAGANQSRIRPAGDGSSNDPLLRDFVYNEGATNRAIGLRMTGLDVGLYDVQSWHFDSTGSVTSTDNFIQISVREQGGSGTILVDDRPFSPDPAAYVIEVTEPGQVLELIFREDDEPTLDDPIDQNRARLNGFTLVTVPEPAGAAALAGLGLLALRRRR